MAKKLIEYEKKYYKLNNEALRKLISENSQVGPEAKIREIIAAEDMGDMFSTIKNWYYGSSGTQDLDSVKKIAHFFSVPVTKILTETDYTWELIEEAKNKPKERTYEAAKEIIRRRFIEFPEDDSKLPPGLPKLFIFYVVCFWTSTLEFYVFCELSPMMLFFSLEYVRFMLGSYFTRKKGIRILENVTFLIEVLVFLSMVFDIFMHYLPK